MKARHKVGALSSCIFLSFSSIPTFAAVEETIITAQRRAESLQEVPKAVSVISADALEVKQVSNVRDLQYQVPNLNIATNTGTASAARIFLRGIGEDESRGAVDQAVGIYVDDVYIGRSVGSLLDVVDLERVEVLRGPQGTLYGRNSNGGAIRLISKKPSTEDSFADVGVTLGSDSRFDARLSGNLAISDTTAVRASFLNRTRDGFHRVIPNGDFIDRSKEVGELDTLALRVALSHDFSDAWNLGIAVDRTEDDSEPVPDSAAPGNDADNNLFTSEPLPSASECSEATPIIFSPIGCFTDFSSSVETQGVSVTLTGDVGDFTVKSLTGYREMEDELSTRISFPYFQETDQDQLSQEFTLSSNFDGAFNFVGGLYYFNEEFSLNSTFVNDFLVEVETESYAAFFQSTYDFSEALSLTTGLRFTSEDRQVFGINETAESGDGSFTARRDIDNSKVTYNVILDYALAEGVMTYASYSTGFKSGGASPDCFSPTACFLEVDNEEVETIEFGLRSDLFEDLLRMNLTYFLNKYDDLQIAATVPTIGFTRFNVDETEIQGIEAEFTLRATANLSFNAILGWLDGEYTSVTELQAGGLIGSGGACADGQSTVECAENLELKNAPEFKGTLGVVYEQPLASGVLGFSLDAAFEDDSWSVVANSPEHTKTEVDTLINARVAYTSSDSNWQLALWGKNLTDEEYARAAVAGSFAQYAAEPLTWGVDARYTF